MLARIVLKESLHRKVNFLLSVIAVATSIGLFVVFYTIGDASKRETTRLMRDMGFNLRIIPKDTDTAKFLATGISDRTMPEEYVYRFATRADLSFNHLVATLQKRIEIGGLQVILTGISQEVAPPGKKKPPMIFKIQPGTVYAGYQVAKYLKLKNGDQIAILGKKFVVRKCLGESGTDDDIRIYADLHDVQNVTGLKGRINEIKALECVCLNPRGTTIDLLRSQLSELIPDAKVIEIRKIAKARERQRRVIQQLYSFVMPFVIIVCGLWIAALSMLNVKARRCEIGIIRALGYAQNYLVALFVGRAFIIGVVGAIIGFLAGTFISLQVGPSIFPVTAKSIRPIYSLLLWSMLIAPGFAVLSSFIPIAIGSTQDPAVALREE